jgi:uncharacterized membrane protein YsdA (DUF1294 family)
MGELLKRRPVLVTAGLALTLTVAVTVALFAGLFGVWSVWPWLVCWIFAVNLITVATYGLDKWIAQRGGWRVPEATLFLLAFLGGSPGALLAMRVFRHKTVKGTFRVVFWLIVALQVTLLVAAAKIMWVKD